jgi:hypothetical protein
VKALASAALVAVAAVFVVAGGFIYGAVGALTTDDDWPNDE